MAFFVVLLLINVAVTVVGMLLRPKQPAGAQPSALGDFTVPTAVQGRAIPVVFGTCLVGGGNVTWWGDFRVDPVYKRVKSGLFSHSNVLQGYRYFIGMQFCLCHGEVDELVDILAAGKHIRYDPFRNYQGVSLTMSGSDPVAVSIDAENLFGGVEKEGGVSGNMSFYRGTRTQTGNSYLTLVQARTAPAYRGICYAVIQQMYVGTTTYLKPISFIVRRCPNPFGYTSPPYHRVRSNYAQFTGGGNGTITDIIIGSSAGAEERFTVTASVTPTLFGDITVFSVDGSAAGHIGLLAMALGHTFTSSQVSFNILVGSIAFAHGDTFTIVSSGGGDANGALAIYDLLTNVIYGLAVPPSLVDDVAFDYAAKLLYNEGLGLSMQIDAQASADSIIGEICRHIDGVLFTDPATGLWVLKLARADYDISTLLTLDVNSVLGPPDFARGSWAETINEVKITYIDQAQEFNQVVSVPVQDMANIAVTGTLRTDTIQFKGISNAGSAALVALRALKAYSSPLAKLKLVANRSAWALRPGAVFLFDWPPLGITGLICRVTQIAYGQLLDGKITVEACEDVFGISHTGFKTVVSAWVNPLSGPAQLAASRLWEVPYHFSTDGIRVMALAVRGDAVSLAFDIYLDPGTGYVYSVTVPSFVPSGLLATAYPIRSDATDTGGITLQAIGANDLARLVSTTALGMTSGSGNNVLLIDEELMSFEAVIRNSDGTVTLAPVMRGILDTVPADHALGARVWLIGDGGDLVRPDVYPSDLTVTAKLLPQSPLGQLALSDVSTATLATASRYLQPYPPGNLCFYQGGSSLAYGSFPYLSLNDAGVSWSHRNRLTQTEFVAQDAGDQGTPEGNYTVEVFINDVSVRTSTGITGTTYSYTAAMRLADDANGLHAVRIAVTGVNGGAHSVPRSSPLFTMTGFGMVFGFYFGGLQTYGFSFGGGFGG